MPNEKLAALEALLFIHGEPLSSKKIEKILGIPAGESSALIEELENSYKDSGRGIRLVTDGEKVQLVTKPEWNTIVEGFVKDQLSEDLSPASLETLAIIAYFGPISRSRIDYQRGVNSTFILRSLLLRGLIERAPDPGNANSFVYSPSVDLLKYLGISKKMELPEYDKFQSLLTSFESQMVSEVESKVESTSEKTS